MNAPAPRIALITHDGRGIGFEIARQIGRSRAPIPIERAQQQPSWSFAHVKILSATTRPRPR